MNPKYSRILEQQINLIKSKAPKPVVTDTAVKDHLGFMANECSGLLSFVKGKSHLYRVNQSHSDGKNSRLHEFEAYRHVKHFEQGISHWKEPKIRYPTATRRLCGVSYP